MLGNCWLFKKLPNYELFLTNSSPEAFTNLWACGNLLYTTVGHIFTNSTC